MWRKTRNVGFGEIWYILQLERISRRNRTRIWKSIRSSISLSSRTASVFGGAKASRRKRYLTATLHPQCNQSRHAIHWLGRDAIKVGIPDSNNPIALQLVPRVSKPEIEFRDSGIYTVRSENDEFGGQSEYFVVRYTGKEEASNLEIQLYVSCQLKRYDVQLGAPLGRT